MGRRSWGSVILGKAMAMAMETGTGTGPGRGGGGREVPADMGAESPPRIIRVKSHFTLGRYWMYPTGIPA
ncbi:hypothetical protein CBR_g38141 [Chara braunii]|uniref:Uncharacterized protein n=1 Tax=Chara braunii TaxID=69332 RepID=A0A388LPA8_CHABU|nr:hypothetical protein CBR_g38141 [Chara braunii]|eukprot:GBG84167.1 hypothetical protein CBR_g38141 [Chara braunii]